MSGLESSLGSSSVSEFKIPSRMEIGLQASRQGDFVTARQMFRKSMNRLKALPEPGTIDSQTRIIQLLTHMGDSYVKEGRYDLARRWYEKAWDKCGSKREHSLLLACLMAKLCKVRVLESDINGFQRYFEKLQSTYLLVQETDTSALLPALTDLFSSLSVNGHVMEAQVTDNLINQIKPLEKEVK
jgi:hypothetical protein